jgi:hypothetical protein
MDPEVNITLNQKKIAFANSEHLEAVLAILKDCGGVPKLVGETEFNTIVNAVTLDAQQNMLTKFINTIDFIKQGGLVQVDL